MARTTTARKIKPAKAPGLSDEQLAIAMYVKQSRGNLVVRARAGTGKTYLIRKCLPLMDGTKAIAAFNRSIASEVRAKVAEDGVRGVDIGTFHSFGFRVLQRHLPGLRIEGREKDSAGFRKFAVIAERLEIPKMLQGVVRRAIDGAQERLFGVIDPRTGKPFHAFGDKEAWLDLARHYALADELPFEDDHVEIQLLCAAQKISPAQAREHLLLNALRFAARGLQLSIKMAREEFRAIRYVGRGLDRQAVEGEKFTGVISFNEMLYLPLYFNMPIPQYDWVCVDEAQDSNPARREFARRMLAPKGRIMLVGDDKQAIYLFAGADSAALDLCITEFNAKVFSMTLTFRCGKAIVDLARRLVPDYRAADSNPDGYVRAIDEKKLADEDFAFGGKVVAVTRENGAVEHIASDAIICRNTAPLVRTAYRLLTKGIGCHVEGRDIGKGLAALAGRWPHLKSISAFSDQLADYAQRERAKLLQAEMEEAAAALSDQVEAIQAVIASLPTGARAGDILTQIDKLFADPPQGEPRKTVTLITAHRAKGLEFDRVFGLGVAKYMPSPNAKTDEALAQEANLEYVLYTRAIKEYCDVRVS